MNKTIFFMNITTPVEKIILTRKSFFYIGKLDRLVLNYRIKIAERKHMTKPLGYLPPPVQGHMGYNTFRHSIKWMASTLALGILSYYAPKTFQATCVGIAGYQIVRFNYLVHRADITKYDHIRSWTINACQVMHSIGFIFGIRSFSWFWSSFKALKHFHLLRSGGHFCVGVFLAGGIMGWLAPPFDDRAGELSRNMRWLEMEDYISNYPRELKDEISSSYLKKFQFFLSAFIPNSLPSFIAKTNFVFCQFSYTYNKSSVLSAYFKSVKKIPPQEGSEWKQWILAIHHFQGLSEPEQNILMPALTRIAENSSKKEVEQLPSELQEKVTETMTF